MAGFAAILKAPDRSFAREHDPHFVVNAQISAPTVDISLDHNVNRNRCAWRNWAEAIQELDRLSEVGHLNRCGPTIKHHWRIGFVSHRAFQHDRIVFTESVN